MAAQELRAVLPEQQRDKLVERWEKVVAALESKAKPLHHPQAAE